MLPTDATVTTSPHALRARCLYVVATMRQHASRRMKTAQQRYRDDQKKKIDCAPQLLKVWQYVCIHHPSMMTLLHKRWRLIRTLNLRLQQLARSESPTFRRCTVLIEDDCIFNTFWPTAPHWRQHLPPCRTKCTIATMKTKMDKQLMQ